ncbi:MAG: FecR family protein [Spirochaetia bacterium]|nr:FecR family protein [Spirochaetia bacterium]
MIIFNSSTFAENNSSVYGLVSFVSGEATVSKNNKSIPAKLSMKVEENDVITTKNGMIRIQITDAYICHIEKNTTVTFKKILESSSIKSYNIDLHKGQVFSRLIHDKNKHSELTISTPTFTAGVRGTEFMVNVNDQEPSAKVEPASEKFIPSGVYVKNGSVDVETIGKKNLQKINVKSGEQAAVEPGQLIKDVLDDYVATKMKILDELRIMKEYNCKLIDEQKEKNRKMLEEFK